MLKFMTCLWYQGTVQVGIKEYYCMMCSFLQLLVCSQLTAPAFHYLDFNMMMVQKAIWKMSQLWRDKSLKWPKLKSRWMWMKSSLMRNLCILISFTELWVMRVLEFGINMIYFLVNSVATTSTKLWCEITNEISSSLLFMSTATW